MYKNSGWLSRWMNRWMELKWHAGEFSEYVGFIPDKSRLFWK